jgi:hypothetical protein
MPLTTIGPDWTKEPVADDQIGAPVLASRA